MLPASIYSPPLCFFHFFPFLVPLNSIFLRETVFRSGGVESERRNSRFPQTIQIIRPIKRGLRLVDCRDFQELEGNF